MGNHINKAWRKEKEIPDLPVDILLDIFSRVDPVTLVRCAAASKFLRRHITDPAFLRQLCRNAYGGFVTSLLVGMFFYCVDHARSFMPVPRSAKIKVSLAPPNFGDDRFMSLFLYKTLESQAGLTVLGRYKLPPDEILAVDLCVSCPATNHYVFLPAARLFGYSHVLLPGDVDDGADRSFRLVVLGAGARTQTFSSRTGAWGPVTRPPAHLDLPHTFVLARPSAVELDGVVHWLYLYRDNHGQASQRGFVLAFRVSTGQATTIEIPQRCLRRRTGDATELRLVPSTDRRLGLLVAEGLEIDMWTLSEDSRSWARSVVVDGARMLQTLPLQYQPLSCPCLSTELEWFAEGCGAVLLQFANCKDASAQTANRGSHPIQKGEGYP